MKSFGLNMCKATVQHDIWDADNVYSDMTQKRAKHDRELLEILGST